MIGMLSCLTGSGLAGLRAGPSDSHDPLWSYSQLLHHLFITNVHCKCFLLRYVVLCCAVLPPGVHKAQQHAGVHPDAQDVQ